MDDTPLRKFLGAFQARSAQARGVDHDEYLEESRREYRAQLQKNWNLSGQDAERRASLRRAIDERVRAKFPSEARDLEIPKELQLLLLRKRRASVVLDNLFPRRQAKNGWLELPKRDQDRPETIDLENFSFLADPISTMHGLQRICKAEASAAAVTLNFRDKFCQDITPFMILRLMWDDMLGVFDGGFMDLPMQKVLHAVGITDGMDIDLVGLRDLSDVWAFPLERRRNAGSSQSERRFAQLQKAEKVADRLCDAIDSWLGKLDPPEELTETGWVGIQSILAEMLNNAERHSDGERGDGRWNVSGFLARRTDDDLGETRLHAYLGIVNLGDTFAESLGRSSPDLAEKLDSYVEKAISAGAKQSRETLLTLAALQDGITCDPEKWEKEQGGVGLPSMLDVVSGLGATLSHGHAPKITILSGRSCICLRTPYVKGLRDNPEAPRTLWFNPNNDRGHPPDTDFVYDVPVGFPGTIISMGFVLDPLNYGSVQDGGDDD
ncbi:MAG: hypothetical protein ABJT31_00595 [Hyphomicrobiales bacterium]